MPKTGSSSIQESLFKQLSDPRFHYIKCMGANASGGMALGFQRDPSQFWAFRAMNTPSQELARRRLTVREQLAAELESIRGRGVTPILSAEHLYWMKEEELRELVDFLPAWSHPVTAVGYVRKPKSFIESFFQQMVKSPVPLPQISGLAPAYRTFFEKFETVLGRGQVSYWLFEPEHFPERCVTRDFCRRLGINNHMDKPLASNEGLSLNALSLLYAYRKFGPPPDQGNLILSHRRWLAGKLGELSGPKLRFHPKMVAAALEARRSDAVWMEERLGVSFQENLTDGDADAIRSEEELLSFRPQALQWLAAQLGPEYANRWSPDMSAQDVADWVHALQVKVVAERRPRGVPKARRNPLTRNFGRLKRML
jgi:hypothetical protein